MKELFDAFPYMGSFLAGILSFLSPCILPLVPVYVSFTTGLTIDELKSSSSIIKRMGSTIAFILGFSTIFITLGASSSLLGNLFVQYQEYLRLIGGVLAIVFGLVTMGFAKFEFLMREKRLHITEGPAGIIGAFLLGVGFSAGWTPCIGPILTSILVYAGATASATYGLKLLALYSLGLAIPFLVTAFAVNTSFVYIKKLQRFTKLFMIISGLILVIFGILLLTNSLTFLIRLFPDIGV